MILLSAPQRIDFRIIYRVSAVVAPLLVLAAILYDKLLPRRTSSTARSFPLLQVPELRLFFLLSLALTGIDYLFLFYWRHSRAYFPFNSPYLPFQGFWDLVVYQARLPYLHTLSFFKPGIAFPWQYPPAIAFLYFPLLLTRHPGTAFLAVSVPALCFIFFGLARRLAAEGLARWQAFALIIVTLLISYPFWLEIELANLEMFIFFFTVAGLLFFFRGRSYVAAILFGLATGMKIFPGVYFGLFLARKQYKQVAVGLLTAGVANVLGLYWLCPDLKLGFREVQLGLAYNRQHYMLTRLQQETGIDHSVYGFLKQALFRHFGGVMPSASVPLYLLIAATLGIAIYFLRIRKMPPLNQVCALCVASIWLPPTSHDYTLIHLYIVWGLLAVLSVRAFRQKEKVPGLMAAMVCCAICFSSESEVIHLSSGFSAQLKCVALFALFFIVLKNPWPQSTVPEFAGIRERREEFVPSPS